MRGSVRIAGVSALVTCLLSSTALAASNADAEIAELKAQLKAVTERLAAIESNQKQQKAASAEAAIAKPTGTAPVATATTTPAKGEGQPVVGGSLPGSYKLPGTNTTVKLGGYVKVDAIEDVGHNYGGQYANFANIPLKTSAQNHLDSEFNMHARQTRVNLETHTPTGLGDMKTFIEFDFFGTGTTVGNGTAGGGNPNTTNGANLQLRQAYGEVGHVLAGQTWSNFMDMSAYPESLDYIGPAGLSFNRNPQIRYTEKAGSMSYSAAIESANADSAVATNDINGSSIPDFTAKAEYKDATFGSVAIRGLLRDVKAANTTSATAPTTDDGFGWGFGLSGKINAFEKDALFFQGVYGDGVGHYLFDVANSNNGSTFKSGVLETQKAYGGYVAYQHVWAPQWRTNLIAGYTGIDNNTAITGTAVNKEVASGHVNLIWNPDPAYRVGLEYMHGYRELESGVEGDLDRVQASFFYLF